MKKTPRFFPSDLEPRERLVYASVTAAFAGLLLLLVWPLFRPLNRIRPFVLEMPLSLFAVTAGVVLSFFLLLGLYLWEGRRGDGGGN